jgi:hypothetical protein
MQSEITKPVELFHVRSTLKEYGGRRDVIMSWFVADASPRDLPYGDLIEGYNTLPHDVRDLLKWTAGTAILEMFTAPQAMQVVAYLRNHFGDDGTHASERVVFPISRTTAPRRAPTESLDPGRFYVLSDEPGWPLPFKVAGACNLRQHERMRLDHTRCATTRDDYLAIHKGCDAAALDAILSETAARLQVLLGADAPPVERAAYMLCNWEEFRDSAVDLIGQTLAYQWVDATLSELFDQATFMRQRRAPRLIGDIARNQWEPPGQPF